MAFDHFMTPPALLERVREFYDGTIDFDAASNAVAQQYVQARIFAVSADDDIISSEPQQGTAYTDALSLRWAYDNIWCNPPYSRDNIQAFTQKVIQDRGYYKQLLYLVNTASDTRWYHSCLHHADAMLLFRGRIKFWKIFDGKAHEKWEGEKSLREGRGKVGNQPRFLNTLFYFGTDPHRFAQHFGTLGKTIFL